MNRAHAMPESRVPERLGLRMAFSAWRGITRRQVWVTFLLGFTLFNHYSVAMDPPGDAADWILRPVFAVAAVFAMLLAVVVADRATGMDPDRWGAYALAVVTGAAAGGVLQTNVAIWVAHSLFPPTEDPQVAPRIGAALYIGLELVMLGGGIVWMRNDRRRSQRARARTHAAELDRIAAQKRSIESDLQAMQARVEPQFLFNTLAQVRDLYREDAARGERMLDELINYLRAAMPRMRDTTSTLGQEIELARAYLAIVAVRLGDRLTVSIDAPAEHGGARMPPMLLLPLVDHVVRAAAAPGPRSIAIRGAAEGALIRLTVSDSADAFTAGRDDAGIADLRERLAALFGAQARLTLGAREDGVSRAVLEMPLESAIADAP